MGAVFACNDSPFQRRIQRPVVNKNANTPLKSVHEQVLRNIITEKKQDPPIRNLLIPDNDTIAVQNEIGFRKIHREAGQGNGDPEESKNGRSAWNTRSVK